MSCGCTGTNCRLEPDDPRHGNRGYNCTCDDCRAANREYARQYRQAAYEAGKHFVRGRLVDGVPRKQRRPGEEPPHGTRARYHWSFGPCRCGACRAANACRCGECSEHGPLEERPRRLPRRSPHRGWIAALELVEPLPFMDLPAPGDFVRADWQDRAACHGLTDLFYAERGHNATQAKRICAGCPVRSECLDAALERRERFGIWGGMSERERRAMRKEMAS